MQIFSTLVLAAPLVMTAVMANPQTYNSYNANPSGNSPANDYNAYGNTKDHSGYNSGYNAKDTKTTYGAKGAAGSDYSGAKDAGDKYPGTKNAVDNYYGTNAYQADTRRHCIQEWFGTAPICRGECPKGWRTIRTAKLADKCEQTTDTKIVASCEMVSKNICINGIKTLCEQCY